MGSWLKTKLDQKSNQTKLDALLQQQLERKLKQQQQKSSSGNNNNKNKKGNDIETTTTGFSSSARPSKQPQNYESLNKDNGDEINRKDLADLDSVVPLSPLPPSSPTSTSTNNNNNNNLLTPSSRDAHYTDAWTSRADKRKKFRLERKLLRNIAREQKLKNEAMLRGIDVDQFPTHKAYSDDSFFFPGYEPLSDDLADHYGTKEPSEIIHNKNKSKK